jgi:3-methylcrotonyl-CoA carboxylase alpha subunit
VFERLLIANRGEIACRIARTARRMGIETVAVYSEADAHARHVAACDRAVPIGPAPARDSYLNIPRIIEAAKVSGAQAIHPGYGFLSENPAFPEACEAAGLIFVGPPAAAMRAMGSKSAAKALMETSGVPLLPGYHGETQTPAFLAEQAARIGFPIVIKAVSGGGGRGMRVVNAAAEFDAALVSATQEAASAFGDRRVLIERFVTRPRHIEMQVFADTHGNAVHLFERDCSAQRRNQKVVEEAPSPGMTEERRAEMGRAAVAAALAVGYVGAGTVEFVADADGFFFLEMNTRLQVEHPVTEMITGYDLVEWQLRVAAGEALPVTQAGIAATGHAVEVRIYAEDPARDYAPSIGTLTAFHMPDETDGVRVDTGVAAGDTVSVHYDAMIAKLICHGPNREDALRKLRAALADCLIAGVTTNLDLLHRIASHPDFIAGGIDTGFIARNADVLLNLSAPPTPAALAAAALVVLDGEAAAARATAAASDDPHSPWHARDQWWLNASPARELTFLFDGSPVPVVIRRDAGFWRIDAGGAGPIQGAIARLSDDHYAITADGLRSTLRAARDDGGLWLRLGGETLRLALQDAAAGADEDAAAGNRLVAPIPGQVTAVHAQPGEAVTRGQVLVVLEAMKTVFRLAATADGVVESVSCAVGDAVQEGQTLVSFAEAADPA